MTRIAKTKIAPEAFALKVARGGALDQAIGRAILGDNRVSILIEIGGELAACDGLAFDISYAGGEGVLRISQGAALACGGGK